MVEAYKELSKRSDLTLEQMRVITERVLNIEKPINSHGIKVAIWAKKDGEFLVEVPF